MSEQSSSFCQAPGDGAGADDAAPQAADLTSPAPDSKRTPAAGRRLLLVSSGTTVAAAIAVLTGLALDVSIATTFGVGRATDAFFVAQRLPVGLGTVVLGGMNLSLVPVIGRWITRHGMTYASRHLTSLLVVVASASVLISVPFAVAAGLIVRLIAPGLPSAESGLAASMLPLLFAVVPLTAVAEVLRAALNARHWFVQPALLNAVLNVVAMAVVLMWGRSGIEVAAWAYVGGAAARVVLAFVQVLRAGYRPRLRAAATAFADRDSWAALHLSLRPAAASSLAPGMRLVEQLFTSFLPAGSISLLAYGYRLVFASSGTVFFRSIVGVLVPRMTEATARLETRRLRRLVTEGFRAMTVISVGLTTVLVTLAVPISLALFHRGGVTHAQAVLLGEVIAVLSLSLVGEAWQRILLAPLYAGLDTKTPFRNALLGATAELVLLPILVLPWGRGYAALFGIAVAFVLSEYVGPVHAILRLRARIGTVRFDWRTMVGPVMLATACATGVAVSALRWLGLADPHPRVVTVSLVGAAVLVVSGIYALVIVLFARRPAYRIRFGAGGDS